MRTPIRRLLTLTALATIATLGIAACGDDGGSSSSTSSAPTVSGAWARTSAAMQSAGAAYMEIKGGTTADKLMSASVPADVSPKVEIHETVMAGAATGSSGMTGMTGMTARARAARPA